jgi:DNA-binding transcriptional LysR family regulator
MDRFSEMQVFARVVEHGGFSSAGRSLSLTPSGVSKLIGRLEDRLGVLLFKRNSRIMVLTPEGQAYYQHVLELLEAMDKAEASVLDATREMSGVLRVYTTLSFACHQLAPMMAEFHELYPDLRVEFHTGTGPLRALDSAMDLAIYPYDMQDSSLIVRKITQLRFVICASPAYLEKHGRPQKPADLMDHVCLNFAMDAPCNTWPVWDEAEGKVGRVMVKGAATATDAEMLLALAREGSGIARLWEDHVAKDVAENRLEVLFPFDQGTAKQSIYAIYQSRRHLASRVRAFLSFLDERLHNQPCRATDLVKGIASPVSLETRERAVGA